MDGHRVKANEEKWLRNEAAGGKGEERREKKALCLCPEFRDFPEL